MKFVCCRQAQEMTEVLQVALVRSPCAQIVDIGEPLDGRRRFGQHPKLRRC
jgi:hypothetical protein